MKHYKYIHFFWHDDLKFNPRIVEMINAPKNGFVVEEHLFVTPYINVYNSISKYDNVIMYETTNPSSAKMINEYAPHGEWLFVHSLPVWYEALRIKPKYRKKIIWRTWGHEFTYMAPKPKQPLKNLIKKVVNFFVKREVNQFRAVGIAGTVDELDIKKRFGNVPTFLMGYPTWYSEKAFCEAIDISAKEHSTTNVLVGHSGHSIDNHIEIMDALEKYREEKIQLYFILSYGDKEYTKKVKEYAEKNWGNKASIISEFLPYEDFLKLCGKMDIVFLDGHQSYALGNVGVLLSLRKKFFLRRNGILHQAFQKDSLPFNCSDEIAKMSFEEFCSKAEYNEGVKSSLFMKTYKTHIDNWHLILQTLSCK